jgi:2-polyprenyl-3-methyl-5-hydroxy-6-metoxy-1,4-benzoquinol methylase
MTGGGPPALSSVPGPWNHNVEYQKVVRAAVGAGPSRVLDVGCGNGLLARELSALGHSVTAIDVDEPSIARARSVVLEPSVDLIVGDFMSYPLERASFEAVVSIAALHHMDERDALERMADLLRRMGSSSSSGSPGLASPQICRGRSLERS